MKTWLNFSCFLFAGCMSAQTHDLTLTERKVPCKRYFAWSKLFHLESSVTRAIFLCPACSFSSLTKVIVRSMCMNKDAPLKCKWNGLAHNWVNGTDKSPVVAFIFSKARAAEPTLCEDAVGGAEIKIQSAQRPHPRNSRQSVFSVEIYCCRLSLSSEFNRSQPALAHTHT